MANMSLFVAGILFFLTVAPVRAQELPNGHQFSELAPVEHHLTKRSYNFSAFNYTAYFDRIYGPETYMNQVGIATALLVLRSGVFVLAGGVYSFLLATTTGQALKRVQSLEYLFGLDVLADAIGRNVRIWVFVLGARLIFDFIFYGPARTIKGLSNKTLRQIIAFPFLNTTTQLFIGRFILESLAVVLGFMTMAAIGQSGFFGNPPPTGRQGRDYFDPSVDVKQKIKSDFQASLAKVEAQMIRNMAWKSELSEL